MNRRKLPQVNMFIAVELFLREFLAAVTAFPAFRAQCDAFSRRVTRIETLVRDCERSTTGTTESKARFGEDLLDSIVVVAGAIGAWAAVESLTGIATQVRVSRSALARLPKAKLASRAEDFLQLATEHKDSLADWGVTDSVLAELSGLIASYRELVSAPRNAIAARVALGEILEREIAETSAFLKGVLDRLMLQFKASQPDLYVRYTNVRSLVNLGKIGRRKKAAQSGETAEAAKQPKSKKPAEVTDKAAETTTATAEASETNTRPTAPAQVPTASRTETPTNDEAGLHG